MAMLLWTFSHTSSCMCVKNHSWVCPWKYNGWVIFILKGKKWHGNKLKIWSLKLGFLNFCLLNNSIHPSAFGSLWASTLNTPRRGPGLKATHKTQTKAEPSSQLEGTRPGAIWDVAKGPGSCPLLQARRSFWHDIQPLLCEVLLEVSCMCLLFSVHITTRKKPTPKKKKMFLILKSETICFSLYSPFLERLDFLYSLIPLSYPK
jgi:hypothetical protein